MASTKRKDLSGAKKGERIRRHESYHTLRNDIINNLPHFKHIIEEIFPKTTATPSSLPSSVMVIVLPVSLIKIINDYWIPSDILHLGAICESFEELTLAYRCYSYELYQHACPILLNNNNNNHDGNNNNGDDDDNDVGDTIHNNNDDHAHTHNNNVNDNEWRSQILDVRSFACYKCALYWDFAPLYLLPPLPSLPSSSRVSLNATAAAASTATTSITASASNDDDENGLKKIIKQHRWSFGYSLLEWLDVLDDKSDDDDDEEEEEDDDDDDKDDHRNKIKPKLVPSHMSRSLLLVRPLPADCKGTIDLKEFHMYTCRYDAYDYLLSCNYLMRTTAKLRYDGPAKCTCNAKKTGRHHSRCARHKALPTWAASDIRPSFSARERKQADSKDEFEHYTDDDCDDDVYESDHSEYLRWKYLYHTIIKQVEESLLQRHTGIPALIGWRATDCIDAWAYLDSSLEQAGTDAGPSLEGGVPVARHLLAALSSRLAAYSLDRGFPNPLTFGKWE